MGANTRWLWLPLTLALAACGGGGGGSNVAPVAAAPPAPAAAAAPGSGSGAYADAAALRPFILAAEVPADGRVRIEFQLTDPDGIAITDLAAADLRLTLAKLGFSPIGNLRGNWQSYINAIELPGVGPGTEPRLQATAERGNSGTLTNNGDGTYVYRFAASITDIADQSILDQAADEGLDLDYRPERNHRVAIEFRGARTPANATFDWIPATGVSELDGLFHYDVVSTANCQNCHQQEGFHGGSRIEARYCVTCHNPGSSDANSGNSVSFRTMVHKIHLGADLPSVQAGTPYLIYGFQDRPHDYSNTRYPGDIRNCSKCHGGNATGAETTVATDAGDNWSEFATREACGSCHDDLDFTIHLGGQPDDSNCMSCHQTSGVAGSIRERHRNLAYEAASSFEPRILSITNTAPGEFPEISFAIVDPAANDAAWDILGDPVWTRPGGASRLSVDLAWSTADYTNTGNGTDSSDAVAIDALVDAVPLGDGSFRVMAPIAVPDGSLVPNVAATGSGAVLIEGHPAMDFGSATAPDVQRIPMTNAEAYFSIDETSGVAAPRRQVVDLESCLACHDKLSLHGSNRTDNIQGCATCHNPRNTDRGVRAVAVNPPSDGKAEESLDLKTMVHGIHASAMRTAPLQIVGFRGFSTNVYDETHVQYPGDLANCLGCHVEASYALPLGDDVLATTFDTGADPADPADDRVISPATAVCASCHDTNTARAHMTANGGSFDTTQQAIDSGAVLEQCQICHGSGRVEDVRLAHGLP